MATYLFTHSNPTESTIKKVISFFGPLKIFLPWYMEPPPFIDDVSMEVVYPPDNLKPKDVFRNMLSEYRSWVKQNQDRSYTEIIKSDRVRNRGEDAIWEIRQMLVRGVGSIPDPEDENIIRWHLLLHLAGEIEEQQAAADRILRTLKEKRSPLEGSIEKALDINSLFGDLPGIDTESSLNDRNLIQVIDAWLGLFGGYLEKKGLLITLNSRIMDYISERWDDLSADDVSTKGTIMFNIPGPSCHTPGKIDEKIKKIIGLIIDLGNAPSENLKSLDTLNLELHDLFSMESSKDTLKCTLKYLYPVSDEALLNSERIFKYLSGKTLLLLEE